MSAKATLLICASAALITVISSQCVRGPYADFGYGLAADVGYNNWGYDGLGYGAYGPVNGLVAPASGGGFPVTSSSPIAPIGLTVTSENVIEGILAVTGDLPVLSAVALEGTLPTIGSGSVVYGCGDGSIGIVSDIAPTLPYGGSLAADFPYPPAGLPYRGFSPLGSCGCGAF